MKAQFLSSGTQTKNFPQAISSQGHPLKEIACLGRSNVGKSSLLNHLFQTQKLVKTSSTPGKTKLLNFFRFQDSLIFVDFPGYGYAKVSDQEKRAFERMTQDYFTHRDALALTLLLFDSRRTPKQEDLDLLSWLQQHTPQTLVIATKIDTIASTKRLHTQKTLEKLFQCPILAYSTKKNIGRKALLGAIYEATS